MNNAVMTVSQLNRYVKSVFDGDYNLQSIFIKGEISNFRLNIASGHCYFTLKDDAATIKCVMFKSDAVRIRFKPEDGLGVICRAKVSLYERDGNYQLYVYDMQPDGLGSLALQFEQIRKKLESEGLFDVSRKRPLPKFPSKIAVLTSETGAAVYDILNILGRRYPLCDVLLVPVAVQGVTAAEDMCFKLDIVYQRNDIDLIIIGRGGGSAEDLSAFNDEALARKLAASPVPTVSAVGHESDVSITDFIADLRASTPSAAAELCVPQKEEIFQYIDSLSKNLSNSVNSLIDKNHSKLYTIMNGYVFKSRDAFWDSFIERINSLNSKLNLCYKNFLENKNVSFSEILGKFNGLNPLNVLARGYSVSYKDNEHIKSVKQVKKNDLINIKMIDGTLKCIVTETEEL